MKVEEIKLALEKNRETHVRFALIDDLNKAANEARASLDKSASLYKSFEDEKKISSKKIDEVEAIIQKAKILENQLGIENKEISQLKLILNALKGRYTANK